jgi:hypothetical protein
VAAVVALYAIAGFLLARGLLARTARLFAADAFDG